MTEVEEIEQRFKAMAIAYAKVSPLLLNWVGNGNKLPAVYLP